MTLRLDTGRVERAVCVDEATAEPRELGSRIDGIGDAENLAVQAVVGGQTGGRLALARDEIALAGIDGLFRQCDAVLGVDACGLCDLVLAFPYLALRPQRVEVVEALEQPVLRHRRARRGEVAAQVGPERGHAGRDAIAQVRARALGGVELRPRAFGRGCGPDVQVVMGRHALRVRAARIGCFVLCVEQRRQFGREDDRRHGRHGLVAHGTGVASVQVAAQRHGPVRVLRVGQPTNGVDATRFGAIERRPGLFQRRRLRRRDARGLANRLVCLSDLDLDRWALGTQRPQLAGQVTPELAGLQFERIVRARRQSGGEACLVSGGIREALLLDLQVAPPGLDLAGQRRDISRQRTAFVGQRVTMLQPALERAKGVDARSDGTKVGDHALRGIETLTRRASDVAGS